MTLLSFIGVCNLPLQSKANTFRLLDIALRVYSRYLMVCDFFRILFLQCDQYFLHSYTIDRQRIIHAVFNITTFFLCSPLSTCFLSFRRSPSRYHTSIIVNRSLVRYRSYQIQVKSPLKAVASLHRFGELRF